MHSDLTWFKTKLLPAGNSIFTKTFYPDEGEESISIFCAVTDLTPSNSRVIIASRMEANAIRVLTPHLALCCIDTANYEMASEGENAQLNIVSGAVLAKVGAT